MASKTQKMREQEEVIKKKIVAAHRAGLTDKNGRGLVSSYSGCGHLHCGLVPFGPQKIKVWPRDEKGFLIGDD